MVGLDVYFQTPPAIEQRSRRQERSGGTTGGIRTKDETREEHEEVESSTGTIQASTGAAGKQPPEKQPVKEATDNKPTHEKVHTGAFSEYLFNRKTAELISLLNDLKANLHGLEGAGAMVAFRRSLDQIWHVAGRLPREKVLVVSAVEEAIRNTKWRELSAGQVEVLQRVLSNVNTPAATSKAEVSRAFRALNKSRIDVLPSAALVVEEEGDEPDADADE